MLTRLFAESRAHQTIADADGIELARIDYPRYLVRRYGFEAPLESALAVTPGITQVIDLQPRQQCRMIVDDLVALGLPLARVLEIPHADVHAFGDIRDALGWLYVSDRSAAAHDRIVQNLARPSVSWARDAVAARDAIGHALEAVARTPQDEVRVVDAAIRAFEHQHRWLGVTASVEPAADTWSSAR